MEFPRTRWTLILACRDQPELQRRALAELLQSYWLPLYQTLRLRGHSAEISEDAVQAFAVHLLERDALARLDPGKGKLRAYLKTALLNHLSSTREKAQAEKRGGNAQTLAIDHELAEKLPSANQGDPESAYQRAWAQALMARALDRLRGEFASGERRGPFSLVEQYFSGNELPAYRELAQQHSMTPVQLKAFLHRARERYRELVREEVADTVADPSEIDAELGELVQAL